MKISIIHPTRGQRFNLAMNALDKWLSKCNNLSNIEYILSLDNNDSFSWPGNIKYNDHSILKLYSDNRSAIDAINNAAKVATGDLFIVVSDDFDCPEHWDTLLLKALEGQSDFIVKTQDGHQSWIITLPILDKKYYARFEYIYPPHIKHMFADTWMTHVADLLDKKITLNLFFEHLHYSAGKGTKDAINTRNESTWSDGERKYLEGVKTNFGLSEDQIKGELTDSELKKWLKNKL